MDKNEASKPQREGFKNSFEVVQLTEVTNTIDQRFNMFIDKWIKMKHQNPIGKDLKNFTLVKLRAGHACVWGLF